MPAEKDVSTWTFAFRNATFDVVRRDPAAHVAMRTEREAATDPSRAPVPGSHADSEGSFWQRLTLEREALQEWPVGEGRWLCAVAGENVWARASVRAPRKARDTVCVDIGPHEELRLPSPDLADLLQFPSLLPEHAASDSPPSLGRDSNPATDGHRQLAHQQDVTAIDASPCPHMYSEKDSLKAPAAPNPPAAMAGDGDGDAPAPPTRGVKRRHDECQADSEGRSSGGKRLRSDASMLLTGAALTYAALAYL